MAEKQNTPEIRFEGFTDPWEQRKLGEVASEFQSGEFISATEITENGDYPVYGGNGLRGYANRYNHEGFYALIGRQGALCGNVNCADGKAYFTEHAVAVQANQCNDTGFLVYLLSRMNLGQYSGQSAQPGLAVSTLKEVETLLPSKYEQYRIGSLLKDLDSLITLHQRKHDKLCTMKKSMLDKMFPKPGETEPEIRFEGFTDPWEQRKLGDCFEFLKNNTLSRADLNGENGTARNVHYGDILIKFGDCLDGERSDLPFITDDTVLPKFAGSILREGDVIFADTAEDEAAGKCVELRKLPKEPTISGLHTIPARPRFPFGTGYLGHYLNSDAYHRQLLPLMQGIKVISVSKAALQDTQVRFPRLSEQAAIGAALSEIDNLITLHQRKLELLRNIKKSLLDRMFV